MPTAPSSPGARRLCLRAAAGAGSAGPGVREARVHLPASPAERCCHHSVRSSHTLCRVPGPGVHGDPSGGVSTHLPGQPPSVIGKNVEGWVLGLGEEPLALPTTSAWDKYKTEIGVCQGAVRPSRLLARKLRGRGRVGTGAKRLPRVGDQTRPDTPLRRGARGVVSAALHPAPIAPLPWSPLTLSRPAGALCPSVTSGSFRLSASPSSP